MNIGTLIGVNVLRFGEYPFAFGEGKWYTNLEINRICNCLGNALKERFGIKKGDRVGIQLPNCVEVTQSFFAISKIGGIFVPVNPRLSASEGAYIYQDAGIKVLISSKQYLPKIRDACREANQLKNIILIDEVDQPNILSYQTLVSQNSEYLDIEDTDNDDIAAILYTAGTTGTPKGVALSHYYFYSAAAGNSETELDYRGTTLKTIVREWSPFTGSLIEREVEVFGIERGRSSLIALPLFHGFGIFVTHRECLMGGKLILLRQWDAEEAMKLIERFKITEFSGVPTMYIQILNHPNLNQYDLSSLKTLASAGAPLPPQVAEEWEKRVKIPIYEGYGCTEALFSLSNRATKGRPKYGSIGRLYRKSDTVKIIDKDRKEVSRGKEGEIVVKGPTVMKGYWNKPEETTEMLRDGWFHTGDLGYMDEDGYIWLTERKKDLIIRGGENIYPREVEDVLYKHPCVFEAGVIGVPDPTFGDEVRAFVALKPGTSVTEEELISFCKQNMPSYKTPKSIQILESLPKSAIGKILRKDLKQRG